MIYPRVNILVLNWNGDQVLNDCVESILETDYENYNLTIIDNGSTDSSLETIDKINIISINKNLGFSKAYNYAFSKLADKKDDYYFLLNNDTIIKNDTISKLIFALRKYGENNIYGSKILNFYNNKVWYAGGRINPYTLSANNIGVNKNDKITEFKTTRTDFISGCALLISKKNINQLGGFNEIYKFYYEDVDLCLKASLEDINSIFVNNSLVLHKISYSMNGRYSFRKIYYKFTSKIKFILNNTPIINSFFLILINIVFLPIYILIKLIKICLLR